MNMFDRFLAFFFAERDARGFGLMRIAWAAIAFLYLLMQWSDVTAYYSDAGYLPWHLESLFLRTSLRFSILDVIGNPTAVFALYLLLLILLLAVMLGWKARWTLIASVLLLFSFHERNPLPLAGGETVLRTLGFLLMISPGIHALSLDRFEEQWRHWKIHRELLPPVRIPSWPYRLLLWQFIVLYATSLWFKSLGTMWISGTAVATVLHHPIFSELPPWLADLAAPFSPLLGYVVMLWHASWLLLVIPHRILRDITGLDAHRLKRWILLGGVLFHGSILLMIRAGSFSLAIFTGYLGLLDEHDLAALKRVFNHSIGNRKISVLYDGRCGLCLRTAFVLELLDGLRRLQFINFWNRHAKNVVARHLSEAQLNRAMHIKIRGRFVKGFDAIRELAWHLPMTMLLAPFLHFPGITSIGNNIYNRIAENRKKCNHKRCRIEVQ